MTLRQEVVLFNTHAELKLDGVTKVVSLSTFKEMLDRVMDRESSVLDPIALPNNTLCFGKTATTVELNTYWPEAKRTIKFLSGGTTREYVVPFPNIVIYFKLTKQGDDTYKVHTARYMCTNKKPGQLLPTPGFIREPNTKDGVFILPVPNMYAEGRPCYGGNTMPNGFKNDFRGLDWYFLFLPESVFNCDLSIPSVPNTYRHANDWITFLKDQPSFPYNILKGT